VFERKTIIHYDFQCGWYRGLQQIIRPGIYRKIYAGTFLREAMRKKRENMSIQRQACLSLDGYILSLLTNAATAIEMSKASFYGLREAMRQQYVF